MEQEHPGHLQRSHEDHIQNKEELLVIKRMMPNEVLAKEMTESGVLADPVPHGTHSIESEEFYSHLFGMNPRLTTNKGVIRVKGKNFDLVQVIQKH